MLPQFYQSHLQKYFSETQLITLKLLVGLLQNNKQVKIERLAATLKEPLFWENLLIFVAQKKQEEQSEDIAILG